MPATGMLDAVAEKSLLEQPKGRPFRLLSQYKSCFAHPSAPAILGRMPIRSSTLAFGLCGAYSMSSVQCLHFFIAVFSLQRVRLKPTHLTRCREQIEACSKAGQ
jgi:hypothetical protein